MSLSSRTSLQCHPFHSSIHYNQSASSLCFTFSDNGFTHVHRMIAGCLYYATHCFLFHPFFSLNIINRQSKSLHRLFRKSCQVFLGRMNETTEQKSRERIICISSTNPKTIIIISLLFRSQRGLWWLKMRNCIKTVSMFSRRFSFS